jgi:hypothetical protein
MKRWPVFRGVLSALVAALVACGGALTEPDRSTDGGATPPGPIGDGGPGAAGDGGAASDGGADGGGELVAAMYPVWRLLDLQPQSPRFNQTYDLAAFQGQPLVVYLIEGF